MTFKMKGSPYPKKSPYKNYKNPQDYKVFNFGNKPTPVKLHKKGHNPDQGDWKPAYEGGDHSWDDLAAMSKEKLKANFPDAHSDITKDLAARKAGKGTKATKDAIKKKTK